MSIISVVIKLEDCRVDEEFFLSYANYYRFVVNYIYM